MLKELTHCLLCNAVQHGLLLCVSCERTMRRIQKKSFREEKHLKEKTLSTKEVERINKEMLEC